MTAPLPLADIPESDVQLAGVRSRANEVVLYGVMGLVLFGVLAFGAVETWVICLLEFFLTLLTTFWVAVQIRRGTLVVNGNPIFRPMGAFFGIVLVQLLASTTMYRHATATALMLYAGYGCACFLMAQTLTRTTDIRRIATALTPSGHC